jgi:Rps23 Pro-64 3,4-dihydroxylase Tpa1-like proline 4-hydroxylase
MINPDVDVDAIAATYAEAVPFPHAVIDNFLEPSIAIAIARALEVEDLTSWKTAPTLEQVNKWWNQDLSALPHEAGSALDWFNSPEALAFFEKVTGIEDLKADLTLEGGGIHITTRGGRLEVHADFNLHPQTGLHRRLNALLYLNRDWDPEWNGQLELWDDGMTACQKRVEPGFNKLVVFNVTDRSLHGFPALVECPPDRRRISLALYYYTEDRPEDEKAPFHWAAWRDSSAAESAHEAEGPGGSSREDQAP